MIRALVLFLVALLCASVARAQQLSIPPETAGNVFECFNSDGDGASCERNQQRSGSWITGDSDGIEDVVLTDEGSVIIPTGSFRKHIVDYRVHFNQGDDTCGPDPIVETPHHAPFVLEFSRTFRTRASYVNYGLTRGWKDNYLYLLNVTDAGAYRTARFEVPSGASMNWLDAGNTGTWVDDNVEMQSMVLALADEAGGAQLVTDRWGGKYHFVPNTSTRPNLQFLLDWLEDENGNRITLTYGADGYPTQAADGFGRVLTYAWTVSEFNGSKHLAWVFLPDGQSLAFQYYFDTQRSYDLTYPNGDVASYGRSQSGGEDYFYFHDPLGTPGARKQRVFTYRLGPAFEYDSGRVRGIQDETGHVQLIRIEDPLTPKITIEYDDGRGFSYDCAFAGLNEKVTNLRTGAETTNEWQLNGGLLKQKIDALGQWRTADYDDARALRVLHHDLGPTTESWTYGPNNRVEDYTDKNGNVVHHDYDVRGNLVRRTYPDASFEEWTRHASGRVLTYRGRNGHTTAYQYDARGNVSAIVLPAEPSEASPVVSYQYDVNGRVLSKTDPVGRVTTYQYDALGRRTRTVHPDATSAEVVYGTMNLASPTDPVATAGLVVARVDRNGNVTEYEYGANDRLVRESGAPGEILHTYDAQDRYVARTENGDVESYGYDTAYRRTSLVRAVDATTAHTTSYAYDLLDRVVSSVDPHGFSSEWTYSGAGQVALLVRQVDGAFVAGTLYTHDGNGNLLSEDDGRLRVYTYDSNDRRVRAYDPAPFDANFVEFTYAPEGQLLSRRDQMGHTTTYAYTNRGLLRQETDATGVVVERRYALDDTLSSVERPATTGQRTFTYDAAGRPATETVAVDGGPNDMTTARTHDGNGNVLQRIDGEGGLTAYEYDARDRLIRATDPLGAETVTLHADDGSPFDARLAPGQGRAVSEIDPNGHARTTVYDGVGRVMRTIDPLGRSTLHAHDVPFGSLEGSVRTDRLGHSSAEYRDGLGRVVRAVDELGNVTSFVYDPTGDLVRMEDARGISTVFDYDSLGRCVAVVYPEPLDTVTFSYQANGLLSERVDQQGNQTQYTYDGAGRLLSVSHGGVPDSFVYDAGGRLLEAVSGPYSNSVERAYDRADRVVMERTSGQATLTYDRRSLPTSITTPSGRTFERTYTAAGRLDTVSLASVLLVDNAYDPAGQLVQRALGNGTSSTWTWDPNGLAASIQHTRGAETLLELLYGHDAEGRKKKQRNLSNLSRNEFFAYDAAGRLIHYQGKTPFFREAPPVPDGEEKGVSKIQDWVLDPVGNWSQYKRNGTLQVRQHTATNQLTHISGVGTLQYKRGNLDDDGVYVYTYDLDNRLREVRRKADDELMAYYTYDALGRRIARTAVDKATVAQRRFQYCYVGDEIVEVREVPSIGPPEFLAAFAHGQELDQPLVMVRPGETYYFHQNASWSTVALTDEDGDLAERYEYDPHGRTLVLQGGYLPIGDTSALNNPFTFQGRENDSEVGLIHCRGRSLSPTLGRYLQRDPAGYTGGMNLYSSAKLVNARAPFGTDG